MQRTKEISDLRPHPLKRLIPKSPEWDKGGEQFNAFCDDIRARGIDTPLLIDGDGFIVDGQVRWLAAKQLNLREVPVHVTTEDAASVMLAGLLHRRHLTKSALAYVAYPLFAAAYDASRRRRLENLRKGQQIPETALNAGSGNTIDEFANSIGVGERNFRYAKQLHEIFTRKPDLRAQFEPEILSGDKALGAVLAGISGQDATKGKAKQTAAQLELFNEGLGTVAKRFTYWQKFDEVTKEAARATIHETVAAMPEDLRDTFEAALRAVKKLASTASKGKAA